MADQKYIVDYPQATYVFPPFTFAEYCGTTPPTITYTAYVTYGSFTDQPLPISPFPISFDPATLKFTVVTSDSNDALLSPYVLTVKGTLPNL